jgi:pimeloyl-ACP methyl ester carboxylesterase
MKTTSANLLPDIQSGSIAGCGHYIAEEQPEELLRVILPFLEGVNNPLSTPAL